MSLLCLELMVRVDYSSSEEEEETGGAQLYPAELESCILSNSSNSKVVHNITESNIPQYPEMMGIDSNMDCSGNEMMDVEEDKPHDEYEIILIEDEMDEPSTEKKSQISNQMTKNKNDTQSIVKLLTYPTPPLTGGITITSEDIKCLDEGEFLNDVIIDFYLKYLFHEKLTSFNKETTHIFSSYFYTRLMYKAQAGNEDLKLIQLKRHQNVKSWTKHTDLFKKEMIFIPVNENHHWYLVVICYPNGLPEIQNVQYHTSDHSPKRDENSMNSSINLVQGPAGSDGECTEGSDHPDGQKGATKGKLPRICIFDSVMCKSRMKTVTIVRQYLEEELTSKKGTSIALNESNLPGHIMRCPKQKNGTDCGIYMLQFVESLFQLTTKIYVGNLPENADSQELHNMFEKFGEVKECEIMKNYAFISMPSEGEADIAIEALNNADFMGQKISVKKPIPFTSPMPDLTNWFSEETIFKKRQEIKDIIYNLRKRKRDSG